MTPKAKALLILQGMKSLTPAKLDAMAGKDPAMAALLKKVIASAG